MCLQNAIYFYNNQNDVNLKLLQNSIWMHYTVYLKRYVFLNNPFGGDLWLIWILEHYLGYGSQENTKEHPLNKNTFSRKSLLLANKFEKKMLLTGITGTRKIFYWNSRWFLHFILLNIFFVNIAKLYSSTLRQKSQEEEKKKISQMSVNRLHWIFSSDTRTSCWLSHTSKACSWYKKRRKWQYFLFTKGYYSNLLSSYYSIRQLMQYKFICRMIQSLFQSSY